MHSEAEAPCTVGNFGPGFDVFSLALDAPGDRIRLEHAPKDAVHVTGPGTDTIPRAWAKNAACATIDAARTLTGEHGPLAVFIDKGQPPGSGLGSSASSNAAALRAFLRLHDRTLQPADAIRAAGAGEAAATGGAHYDDVAAALYGGLTVVGGEGPDAVLRLTPPPIRLIVARPHVELPTRQMRAAIPQAIPRADVVANLSRVARITHACHTQDAALLCRAMDDAIAVPYRAPLVPCFTDARDAARNAGAHGFILCGSGPAMAAVIPNDDPADGIEAAMREAFHKAGVRASFFQARPAPEVNDIALPLH